MHKIISTKNILYLQFVDKCPQRFYDGYIEKIFYNTHANS